MWNFEPINNTQVSIAKPMSGVFRFGAAKIEVATSKTDIFRFETAKTSVSSDSAPRVDNKEGPIKKKVKKKKRRVKNNYKIRQMELEKKEDKKRDTKQARWKEKARIKNKDLIKGVHPLGKHKTILKSRRREVKKTGVKRVCNKTNNAKTKCKKNYAVYNKQ